MSIITHLIALMLGCWIGIGTMALIMANRNTEDEHNDSWRDR